MTGETKTYQKKALTILARGPITEPETIETLEGTMRADVGDYVITGITGEQYPIKAPIFLASYDAAE